MAALDTGIIFAYMHSFLCEAQRLMNNNINATAPLKKAFEYGVGFPAGEMFSSSGEYKNVIRLSFVHYSASEIGMGIERLSTLLREQEV